MRLQQWINHQTFLVKTLFTEAHTRYAYIPLGTNHVGGCAYLSHHSTSALTHIRYERVSIIPSVLSPLNTCAFTPSRFHFLGLFISILLSGGRCAGPVEPAGELV